MPSQIPRLSNIADQALPLPDLGSHAVISGLVRLVSPLQTRDISLISAKQKARCAKVSEVSVEHLRIRGACTRQHNVFMSANFSALLIHLGKLSRSRLLEKRVLRLNGTASLQCKLDVIRRINSKSRSGLQHPRVSARVAMSRV